MQLRTSYFNGTVLRKDLTRFAPVWGLYAVFLLLVLLTSFSSSANAAMTAMDLQYLMSPMAVVNLIYAGLCATLLFGDLFNSRLCNALHAMPMRREGWFLTHLTAGFLFCLIPCGGATLIACLLTQQYCYMALLWLAVTLLQFLFFFGVGVFSVMCAGNRLGMFAIYGLINFLAVLVYALVEMFYEPLLHGITLETDRFLRFCPVLHIPNNEYVLAEYDNMRETLLWNGFQSEPWIYLFVVAGIGAVLLVLSVLIYRRRKLESAGDFIALRPVAPVFLVLYTLGAGGILYWISMGLVGVSNLIFLLVGLAVGFFTGKMLLARTIKVFQWKSIGAFVLLTAVLAGTMVLTWLDPAGITRYVPEADEIETAYLYSSNDYYRYQNEHIYSRRELTSPEDIELCRQIHGELTEHRQIGGDYLSDVRVEYRLKDGTTVTRCYTVYQDFTALEELEDYLSDARTVFQVNDWEAYAGTLVWAECEMYDKDTDYGTVSANLTDREQLDGLLAAIKADCDAGNMAQDWGFHEGEECQAWIWFYADGDYNESSLNIYDCCENTLEYLHSLESEFSETTYSD